MARAFEKKSDFNEIQKLIHGSPLFVDIETAMMIVANNFKSDADFAFHAFSWPDVKCVVMVCRNKYCLPFVVCKMLHENQCCNELNDRLQDIFKNLEDCNDNGIALYSTYDLLENELSAILSPNYNIPSASSSYTYIMSKKTQHKVAKMDIHLPEGFEFCELDPERDAKFISSQWKYGSVTEEVNTKSKLTTLPSVGIKFGDQLVAFEMCFSSGAMNHLYADPEFRGKGLGTAVELRLSQKLIALGITPHKFVDIDSPVATAFAEKSKYFSRVVSEVSGQPVLYDCRHVTKKTASSTECVSILDER